MVRVSHQFTQSHRQKEKRKETARVLSQMYKLSEERQAAQIAKAVGLPYIDLFLFPTDKDAVSVIPEQTARDLRCTCFHKSGKNVRIAIQDVDTENLKEYLLDREETDGWKITLYIASLSSLRKAWETYKTLPILMDTSAFAVNLTGEDVSGFEEELGELMRLKRTIKEASTTRILNVILSGAIAMDASDIHLEPEEKKIRLRYRLDGILQTVTDFPTDIHKSLVNRLKIMGSLKLNIRDISQDGRFSISVDDEELDVRLSIIPGNHGETIVMRLLNKSKMLISVEDLGLRGAAHDEVRRQIKKPNGMILNTGPTGSGKTTSLYAILNELNSPDIKIITIEDPIEYQIEGISQTQVHRSRGYTFAKGLRAIVRQDPDVILVGEIRDDETADIAVNAALTGHLVLSTIHTNSAPGAVARLIELGVKPNLLTSGLNTLIGQRLVRRLCVHCKEQYIPAEESVDIIKKLLAMISPKAKVEVPKDIPYMYRPTGCGKCHNTGYKGRLGIFEVFSLNDELIELIENMESEETITRAALEAGMVTMTQDGIVKAVEGITSMDEVWRVTAQRELLENAYEKLMEQTLGRSLDVPDSVEEAVEKTTKDDRSFSELLADTKQTDLLETVMSAALARNAGDIHIEPERDDIIIRLRIDGILHTVGSLPLNLYPALLGEIKLLCNLKTDVRAGIKDGRFSIAMASEETGAKSRVDVRVSIIFGGFGETVVMRLLNQSATALELDLLGIRKENLDKILAASRRPNGMIVNTGPTGSGKTTTLYSILSLLNKPETKIITVEDPIEYQIDGVLQTQVNAQEGYTFQTAMRSLLRQNPDIMMVGEIRDGETAQISVEAALTGHLVLSTLHTNNAAGSVQRLLNMGVGADDIASAFSIFMAQRLVRKVCEHCTTFEEPTRDERVLLERVAQSVSKASGVTVPEIEKIPRTHGCKDCNGIGYKGRTVVSEVMTLSNPLRELIVGHALTNDIQAKAIEEGMITMSQDGIVKVLEHMTTIEEVQRVTEE